VGTVEVQLGMVVGEEWRCQIWQGRRPTGSGGEGGWSWVEKDSLGRRCGRHGEDGLGVAAWRTWLVSVSLCRQDFESKWRGGWGEYQ
jgi:hypothetical protein